MCDEEAGAPRDWINEITKKFDWMVKQNIPGDSHHWCTEQAGNALKLAVYEAFFAGAIHSLSINSGPQYLVVTQEQFDKIKEGAKKS